MCCFEQILEATPNKMAIHKQSDEQDMLGTAGEIRMKLNGMLSCGLLHMDTPVSDNQQRLTFISFVWTLDIG